MVVERGCRGRGQGHGQLELRVQAIVLRCLFDLELLRISLREVSLHVFPHFLMHEA